MYAFLDEISSKCLEFLENKDRIILCITGMSGVGKSTFGKYIRKNGLPGISKYKISVIDDSVMSLDLFYVFNKRIKIKTLKKDELTPFINLLPSRKKVIVYVNTTPQKRLSNCDIILELVLNEETRIKRLKKRDKKLVDNHYINCNNMNNNLENQFYIKKEINV